MSSPSLASRPKPSPPESTSQTNRVLILGLDGATFELLDPLFKRSIMPKLARFARNGACATLRSTEPYVTAPAWTSIVTGKRPDTHGIFDWSTPLPNSYQRHMVSARFRRDLAFWEILAARGLPAGVINLPLSYPPDSSPSFYIGDMFTPPQETQLARPASLRRYLKTLNYRIDIRKRDYFSRGQHQFIHDLTAMTRARGQAIRYCLKSYPWRAAIAVFVGPDRLQHACWEHLPVDDQRPTQHTDRALQYYRVLDEELGKILAQITPSTHVYVVSDHGFGCHRRAFYINDWLEAEGYLVLKRESGRRRRTRRGLQAGARMLGIRSTDKSRHGEETRSGPGLLRAAIRDGVEKLGHGLTPDAPAVDWRRTTAFADSPHGVRINLRGREPCGTVHQEAYAGLRIEIASKLLRLIDPIIQAPFHALVEPREARYWGEQTHLAPDLVYTFRDFSATWRIGPIASLQTGRRLGESFFVTDTGWETGTHRPDGVLIAAGPEIQSGVAGGCFRPWDILPTLLYHLEESIPPDMEGLVMRPLLRTEILRTRDEDWTGQKSRLPQMGMEGKLNGTGRSNLWRNQAEEAAVMDHLRALGYLE